MHDDTCDLSFIFADVVPRKGEISLPHLAMVAGRQGKRLGHDRAPARPRRRSTPRLRHVGELHDALGARPVIAPREVRGVAKDAAPQGQGLLSATRLFHGYAPRAASSSASIYRAG